MSGKPVLVVAGGGSGGHLYPALAVADELTRLKPDLRLVFLGTDRDIDGSVLSAYPGELVRQPVRPLPRRAWHAPRFLLAWRASTGLCRRMFGEQRPIAVLGTGGYASAPGVCEGAKLDIPTALLNPDAVPGKANRYLSSRVDAVFAQWPDTVGHFNGRVPVQVTGCPVRPEFKSVSRAEGLEHFGLDADKKVLLVTGASQGARSVNRAVVAAVPELAGSGVWQEWQLLHLTGKSEEESVAGAYAECGVTARVVGFTRHMACALAAADLVVSRAGASTLAEITAMGCPSILMPYPHHSDLHQVANARVLVKLGAARIVLDRIEPERNGPALAEALRRLMQDPKELGQLGGAAKRIGTTNAAVTVAEQLLEMAARRNGG